MDETRTSGQSLWNRITNDPEFIKGKHEIQVRYELPLNYDIRLHPRRWTKWLGQDERPTSKKAKHGQAFFHDIHTLFKKFEVPEAWHNDLIADIVGSSSSENWSVPRFETYKDPDGNWKWQCIITPETDLTNSENLELIKEQQKRWAGDPPKPIPNELNPRKLDWQPVYEWHKKHPLFTLKEIAKKIGYPTDKVRSKIAELEPKKR